jgi:anthranilate phosphoribosyltransferase
VVELKHGEIRRFDLSPGDAGLPLTDLDGLLCGAPADSAASIIALLDGGRGAFRDIVLLNSAAALIVAGRAQSLAEGVELAAASIDDGKAARALANLIALGKA